MGLYESFCYLALQRSLIRSCSSVFPPLAFPLKDTPFSSSPRSPDVSSCQQYVRFTSFFSSAAPIVLLGFVICFILASSLKSVPLPLPLAIIPHPSQPLVCNFYTPIILHWQLHPQIPPVAGPWASQNRWKELAGQGLRGARAVGGSRNIVVWRGRERVVWWWQA